MKTHLSQNTNIPIAIIGLSGRFPGAGSISEFWDLIKNGKQAISYYTREELLEKGVDPSLLDRSDYIKADATIESADKFDSSFFGYTPREADFMDPQHRVFLEVSYAALENAGYDPERYLGDIGVFAGCSRNNYWLKNLSQHHEILRSLGELQTIVNNDKDFLTTRVSYKLNLTGPSVDIQTACSTSLVAIHFACQSLITHQTDMAIGGGVFIKTPRGEGYVYEDGSIDSPTGYCRPFDANADGTIFGEGAGVVVLKRLEDAIRDRDTIHAVIKASAINNDGSLKVGYMAPAIDGQTRVISRAQEIGGIEPDTIGYIEAHGTGTFMGDPIETAALRKVFGYNPEKRNYCAVGSVKANIGHLDAAAGVTGLISAALVLENKQIPPLLNFRKLNPELNLEESAFYINTEKKDWLIEKGPRRAAVSSFGIGGTNAHAILEEYVGVKHENSSRRFHIMPLSAKTPTALEKMKDNLISHILESDQDIADISYTLQNGRKMYKHRGILIWDSNRNKEQNVENLQFFKSAQKQVNPSAVFMFTGQGSQYINMAAGLYKDFDSVKTIIDYAHSLLEESHNIDLLGILFPENNDDETKAAINETAIAQPALFVIQFAIANLLQEYGIRPASLVGHSIGEYTAACMAGVFSFEDGLNIVASRGELMQKQKTGVMLSVNLPKNEVIKLLSNDVNLALNNAPEFCVVSGTKDSIDEFEKKLLSVHPTVRVTRLKTSHAFHSYLMDPAVDPFRKIIEQTELHTPEIPFISNVTGTWIKAEEATSPDYWASHIRSMVNFSDGIYEILKNENTVFIECGPGNSLSLLLSQYPLKKEANCIQSMRHPKQSIADTEQFFKAIAGFWSTGGNVDWSLLYEDEERFRVPLPSYPFEWKRHWIDPKSPFSYYTTETVIRQEIISENFKVKDQTEKIHQESYHARPELENKFVSPETDIEKKIIKIWEDLLGIKGIGLDDNFFDLGGHSLLAAQIVNRINDEAGTSLPVEFLFEASTVREILAHENFGSTTPHPEEVITKIELTDELPVSFEQERLWLIHQIDGDNPAYNIPFTFKLKGKIDKAVFIESLQVLFNRHTILKSVFTAVDGKPKCRITDNEIIIREEDFSKWSEEKLDKKIQEFIAEDTRSNFDIENGPLYRISLIKLAADSLLFQLTVHHLVFDGWSWGIFTREFSNIYNSLIEGNEIKLQIPELQYYDYSGWQQNLDTDTRYQKSSDYWKEQLKAVPDAIKFPYDFNRKKIPSGIGGREAVSISAELTDKLKELSRKENSTLYMTLLSAFGLLLNRYSGDKDICIGSPTANRPDSKLEEIIGLFINSIVLRLQFDGKMSFLEFLQNTRQTSLQAIAHQDLPFEKLVDILNPARSLNINPIFQVMFAWQNAPRPPLNLNGITTERVIQRESVSPLDITFYAWEEDGKIEGEIEFSQDIIKRETIINFRDNFVELLENILIEPTKAIGDYYVLSENEQVLLETFNNTIATFPKLLVHELLEEQSVKNPGHTALIAGNEMLSYDELNRKSNQLANFLISKGVRQNDIVGISLERTSDMLVSVMAILKSGAAYLPMDPAFPADRLIYMYEDSGAKFLLSQDSLNDKFSELTGKKIILENEAGKIKHFPESKPIIKSDPQSLAYLIYTSGSTGKPKGVKVHHQAVVNFMNSMAKKPGITSNDRLLAVTTLSFDISVLELFLPLSQGAGIVLAKSEDVSDGSLLAKMLEEEEITILQATPATWNILLSSGWNGKKDLKALCGGEAISSKLVAEVLPKVESLWNMYGPTETTVWSACYQFTDPDSPVLVGKPIDNTSIYIMNDQLSIQPAGVAGELCIGGLGVTKGYHNREELTAEKFIRLDNRELVYRTGDLAKYHKDGNIELYGRIDNQIKLRGFRIEPGEIENLLTAIPGIREAVVKVQHFSDLDESLIAFLNISDKFELSNDEIIRQLSKNLPNYMIPGGFSLLNEFPRTPNGKIDKKALVFDRNEMVVSDNFVEPSTPAEKELAAIWKELLGINKTGIHDDFFHLGGHSLLASQAVTRINNHFGSNLSLRSIFEHSTIHEISIQLNGKADNKIVKKLETHLTDLSNLPLTPEQKRLWIFCKMNPDNPAYNIPFTYRIKGVLDINIFKQSLEVLFNRHHVLYSVFKNKNGIPYIEIDESKIPDLKEHDFSSLKEKEKSDLLHSLILENTRKPFDIENGPLYRLILIKTGVNEHHFYGNIHHLLFDGWSWGLFIEELNVIYKSLLKNEIIPLPKPELQAYDYAFYQEANVQESDEDLIKFWKEYLDDSKAITKFPWDKARKEVPGGIGGREYIAIPEEFTSILKEFSKKEKVSLYITMLSAFSILMQKYTGENDLNIGTPIANRPFPELEKVFGMFVNTIVMRMKFEGVNTFRDLIRIVNESAFKVTAHKDLPFEKVVEIVKPERAHNINPLFQISFVWQTNLNRPISLEGTQGERLIFEDGISPMDLTFYMWENEDIIEGEIEYNSDILNRDTVIRLRDNFLTLISGLTESLDSELKKLQVVSNEEIELLSSFNDTFRPYPSDKTLIQLFSEIAATFPSKLAVSFKNDKLSYSELDKKSNRLAHSLRKLGVERDMPVALLTEKSVELIVGILAILKSGGAYLPIDPDYPADRINFMLNDSGSKIMLSQDKFMQNDYGSISRLNLNNELSWSDDESLPVNINDPRDLAYIMYTSGTTGTPKGSMIMQHAVTRLVRDTDYVNLTDEDSVLATGAIVFDVSTFEYWGVLLNGCSLYFAEKDVLLNPNKLGKMLKENSITTLFLTPALFNQLVEVGTEIFSGLKRLYLGGDVLSVSHINKLRRNNPDIIINNGYGPTENTGCSTSYFIEREFDGPIPIGKPISNSTAYILDENMNYLPIGVTGELLLGGAGLSRGYLNREDLNKTRFINHPFNPGEKLYRSGDLASWMPDGNIAFHGRADDQLKVRGFRVEPGEIEAVIAKLDGVVEVVVKPLRTTDDLKLIAFLNVNDSFAYESRDIAPLLTDKLPYYMIPSGFKIMKGFPKTINGKIDKKALIFKEEELSGQKQQRNFNPTEEKLFKIWTSILKHDNINSSDNFFEIGGNSLLSISMANKIENEFGFNVNFRDLVKNPTIQGLAVLLDESVQKEERIELKHTETLKNLPLSSNQKRLWLVNRLTPDIPSYIIPFTHQLKGELDTDLFRVSLDILFRRHHIIHSRIIEVNNEPRCEIVIEKVKINNIDLSDLPEDEKHSELMKIINENSTKAFDLEKGPLYRLFLIKAGENKHYFHFNVHHIIFDGWSLQIFNGELGQIYNSLTTGKELKLKEVKFQQYDYAVWEQENPDRELNEESVTYWSKKLVEAPPVINFPYDNPRKKIPSGLGGREIFSLQKVIAERLKEFSKKENVSLFSTMLSSFGLILQKYTGENDICIGTPIASRPVTEMEDVFGMFVNTLVLRMKFEKGSSFRKLVRNANEEALESFAHQDIPFEKVVDLIKPERSLNINPIFQVSFAWQNNFNISMNLENIETKRITGDGGISAFDLSFYMWEEDDTIAGEIEYNTDLLNRETIKELRDNFLSLITKITENFDEDYKKISIVSEEQIKILNGFTDTMGAYPSEKTIIELFSEQVKKFPDKTAVVFKHDSLSYSEIDKLSNRLAHTLIKNGVERDMRVALLVDKSMEMITAILAILKAGGAYLPIDPEYPQERINYMLKDGGCSIILTHEKYMDKEFEGVKILSINDPESYSSITTSPENINKSTDLAYVMYTSGTTGTPKGSAIQQNSVVRLVRDTNYIQFTPDDRVLLTGAVVFDATTFEIWGALLNGGSLFVVEKETILKPQDLGEQLLNNDITVIWLTSPLFTQIAETRVDIFSKLKYFFTGGDVVSVYHINKLRKANPDLIIYNVYGPTENTTYSTYYSVLQPLDRAIPIGKPISNSTCYIFDDNLNYQPIGIIGELYLGGDGLSRGYLNNDELNKAKFIEHPVTGERLYKTGDRARWLPDGNIEFHGRLDNQLKIRGFRVELEEIESVISKIDGVVETIVKPFKISEGDVRLVAFLNVRPEFNKELPDLNALIKDKLPPYMVPSGFKIMYGFPKNVNGKIDKKALVFDVEELITDKKLDLSTFTPTELKIYQIWSDILKVKNIGISDNFFEIGGNSLLAISILSRIEADLETEINLRLFFDSPRIKDIAENIDIAKVISAKKDQPEAANSVGVKIVKGTI